MPSFKDATPGVQEQASSNYAQTMEQNIEQSRAGNKVAAHGRAIRQLRESMEMEKAKTSDEESLQIESAPKVEN
ncbi:unnamed protein product [Sphagnum jensenii]|uniref:Uncharacterized protein n=1 Tax=Sphagnum jensenii TaxID=128206 RepID=A0ABP0VJ40_9BRYO